MAYDDDIGYGDDRLGMRSHAARTEAQKAREAIEARTVRRSVAKYARTTATPQDVEADLLAALGLS